MCVSVSFSADALVTMCVPVEIEWGCFPPEIPPPPPAAFIIRYRALVIEGMENVPPLDQVNILVVAIADLKMIRIKINFKRILQKHKTRFF